MTEIETPSQGGDDSDAPGREDSVRPLVTFALFAYNQERYVREAIEGAFSQTYEPLEIILSDDCSTDQTFEIMREAVAAYRGPHSLVLNKTPKNIGVFQHLIDVASFARGALLVLAAGDDISKPNRVEDICQFWQDSGAWGIYSRFDIIDGVSSTIKEDVYSPPYNKDMNKFMKCPEALEFVHGASSAYDARIFSYTPRPKNIIHNEDVILSISLNLLGKKIALCNKSLIKYRVHNQAKTNRPQMADTIDNLRFSEERLYAAAKHYVNVIDYITGELGPYMYNRCSHTHRRLDHRAIRGLRHIAVIQSKMAEASFIERIGMLFRSRDMLTWRWLGPRLFGVDMLWLIKTYAKYLGRGPRFSKYQQ